MWGPITSPDRTGTGDVLFCDINGARTGEAGIAGSGVGKINVFAFPTGVVIRRASAKLALARLSVNKINGRFFKIRKFSRAPYFLIFSACSPDPIMA